jgi:hypothetical protein
MNMPIIVRLATKADLSNRSAAVALRDFEPLMTAVGQTRTFGDGGSMSGLPPKADIGGRHWHVRLVPIGDIVLPRPLATVVVFALRVWRTCPRATH